MKMIIRAVFATVVAITAAGYAVADEYTETIERFRSSGAGDMIDVAYGYAVFPTVGKGGIGLGGAYGEGQVFAAGESVGTAALRQVTVGFQLGGQAFSQMILFQDKRAFDDFTSGNFEFGAQATAVALTSAAGAEASTQCSGTNVSGGKNDASISSTGFTKGMAIFTIAKGGLMFEASIGGQKFKYTPNKK